MPPQALPPGPGQALSADSTIGATMPPEVRLVQLQDSRLLTVLLQVWTHLARSPQRNRDMQYRAVGKLVTGRGSASAGFGEAL
jgi:hypothetical protein